MNLIHDYFYRFPPVALQTPGRCRVRIYQRAPGAHTVLLTELASNPGESIAAACTRIATHLTAVRRLNPKTTRWVQHDPPDEDQLQAFDELKFTWDDDRTASDPRWQRLDEEQAEALTGESVDALNRRLGDSVSLGVEGPAHERDETKSVA